MKENRERTERQIQIIEALLNRAEQDASRYESAGKSTEKLQGDIADYMEQLHTLYPST